MIRQAVYYDEIDAMIYPYWYGIRFEDDDVDWSEETFYFDVTAPFERIKTTDLDDSLMSVSIDSAEILKSTLRPNRLGISLSRIKARALEQDANVHYIRQFILLVADVEECLLLNNQRW
ncbi:hypothetical protein [Cytobacillus gottheilii]|uniref:DUF1828 domain-containing protein n=1 Tax=Cytobacillus gottheilii TaxID=859144 RepID=A0ABX8FA22_9BACI|nr:hypothetical protein [Cytobacillus gottheilii]QVY60975.1 hypothetical protein J1899_18690 [Cytobacillus gottheilii]